MIDSSFPIELNGVKYHLAEDAEGQHYTYTEEPLRAPNTQIVQGENAQKFNIRPDLLLWTWTDWSGGEGQLRWSAEDPNRSRILSGVRWWQRPGSLSVGYRPLIAVDYLGSTFTQDVGLAVVDGVLYALGVGAAADDMWERNYSGGPTGEYNSFNDSSSMATTDGVVDPKSLIGDQVYVFFIKHGTNDMYRAPVSGASATLFNNQMSAAGSGSASIAKLGNYFYVYFPEAAEVYEISRFTANTSTAETPILDLGDSLILTGTTRLQPNRLVAAGNRVYMMWSKGGEDTIIYEIVPSTASGTGSGSELTRIPGVVGEDLWYHNGMLFFIGLDNSEGRSGGRRIAFYLAPGGAFGSLGELRTWSTDFQALVSPTARGDRTGRVDSHGIVLGSGLTLTSDEYEEMMLFEVDAVTGNLGGSGLSPGIQTNQRGFRTGLFFDSSFYSIATYNRLNTDTYRTVFWDISRYDSTPVEVVSPAIDFDIAAEKVLHSIEIVTEPLPASCSVQVQYRLDGGTWTTAFTSSTTSSTGYYQTISTDSSTKTFRLMEIKLILTATASASPEIRSVNVRSSVIQHMKVWNLLLDCSDETAPRGHTGATLMDNLIGIADDTVVDYKDGYQNRKPGSYDQFDVAVDRLSFQVGQPGEGVASVVLREVV